MTYTSDEITNGNGLLTYVKPKAPPSRIDTWHFDTPDKRRPGTWRRDLIQTSRRRVEVFVSPTGRSQRVWVDGVEIKEVNKGA